MAPQPDDLSYHAARVLILVDAFSGSRGQLKGMTKLAKLDFLLRYPMFLDRLLLARGLSWPPGTEPSLSERSAVESRMMRYKFGPWDDNYYPILGLLIGKGLIKSARSSDGSTTFRSTPVGRQAAKDLSSSLWRSSAERAKLLKEHFDTTGNELKDMIYREFAAELDIPWRKEIY